MKNQRVQTLHLWTAGDKDVGIGSESAEVTAPEWLVCSEHYDEADYKAVLEEFRQKITEAFAVIWPNEKIHAQYDFELQVEDVPLDASGS